MNNVWKRSFGVGAALALLLPAVPMSAQDATTNRIVVPYPVRNEEVVYQAPTIVQKEIGLMEAVRIALANDPNIRLQTESVEFQRGLLQEASGQFDTTFTGSMLFQYTKTEQPQQSIDGEKKKRAEKRDEINELIKRESETLTQIKDVEQLLENPENTAGLSDPAFEAQINLLNASIAATEDPAVKQELLDLRDQVLDETFNELLSDLAETREKLRRSSEDLRKLGVSPTTAENYFGSIDLGMRRQFRTGVLFEPFFKLSGEQARTPGKKQGSAFGGPGVKPLYKSEIGLTFDVPLGRNAGEEATAAFEKSSMIDFEASRLALEHSASTTVFSTVLAYWDLVGAQERLKAFEQSAVLQTRLLELTDALIQGDELPGVEINRIQASKANIDATVVSARRALRESRIRLAQTIGLVVDSEENAPLASGRFPEPVALADVDAIAVDKLISTAIAGRDDLKSALQAQESGKVLLRAAQLNLKPVFGVNSQIKYTGLGENVNFGAGVREALTGDWVGPSARVGVSFEKPMRNDTQKGLYMQADAGYRQRSISATELERSIKSGVVTSYGSLRESVAQLVENARAVGYYRQTVDAEFERLQLGASTLIDAIQTEQRNTDVALSGISARQDFAFQLARLRFETATLVTQGKDGNEVNEADLVTVPFLSAKSN